MSVQKIYRTIQNKETKFECIENNKKLLENLKCSICLDFFTEPQTTSCEHVFCKDCILPIFDDNDGIISGNCPFCRKLIYKDELRANFILNNIIGSIKIRCLQTCEGNTCSKILEITGINNHIIEECDHIILNCKYDCGFKGDRQHIIDHNIDCFRNLKIGLSDCAVRRLARKAGLRRINKNTYDSIRGVFKSHLSEIITHSIRHAKYNNRVIIEHTDVMKSIYSIHSAGFMYLYSTTPCIRKNPFARIVRKIVENIGNFKCTQSALNTLQKQIEHFIIGYFVIVVKK